MLNGRLLGHQLGQTVILEDPFAGQSNLKLALPGAVHVQVGPQVAGVSQNHNYHNNLDPSTGLLYQVPGAVHRQASEAVFLGPVVKQGFLFVTLTHSSGVTQRMSNESLDGGTHYWKQQVQRLPSLSYEAKPKGGYVTVTWGKLSFFDGVFEDANGGLIAPPSVIGVTLEWGWKDNRTKLIFDGQGALRQVAESGTEYDLFEPEFKTLALEEGTGFSRTLAVTALVGDGTLLTLTTGIPHGYGISEPVILQQTGNKASNLWAGRYIVTRVINATQFQLKSATTGTYTVGSLECSNEIIPLPLVLGTPGHPKLARTGFSNEYRYYRPNYGAVLGSGLSLFDDGVDITLASWGPDNLANPYLERGISQVFGQLTATGTGTINNLQELFVWAASKLGLTLNSLDLSRAVLLPLDHTQSSQGALIDLLDQVAGYSGFAFYIQSGVLTLFDRAQAHGNLGALTDFDLKDVSYNLPIPAKSWSARWSVRRPGRQRADNAGSGLGVPVMVEVPKEVVLLGSNALGQRKEIKVYTETEPLARARLEVIKGYAETIEARLTSPLERFPALGEALIYLDNNLSPARTFTGKVWSVELNFDQDLLTIKAKGGLV